MTDEQHEFMVKLACDAADEVKVADDADPNDVFSTWSNLFLSKCKENGVRQ